ncbi:hypothetical protein CFC21_037300 [Triticum aestivum]|uniref:Uncharacterized protein n=3 Tax=Triticum TaxID=4564 RepID=A0A9R0VPZ1_TRITD|nr:hypothetical protein CFC21_037300 [Triticum aestivum]VAH67024.1 unnamed protein product [Triticum turgidum subsp. durum]
MDAHRNRSFFFVVVVAAAAMFTMSFVGCADAVRPMPSSPASSTTASALVSSLMEMLPMGPSGGGAGH